MGQWDPENLSDAFILLSQLSLAELNFQPGGVQFGYVSLHPLVRDWIRLRTPRDACPGYSSLVATCIFRLLLSKREINRIYYEEPTARQRLADHVKTYTNNIVKFSSGQNSTAFEVPYDDSGRPALEFAFLLHTHGQFSRSEAWYRQSLAMRTAQFGLGDPLTLNSLKNLSTILHLQQKYVEATHIRKKILDIKARIFGEADSATWAARMDLAGALASQGLYTEAEEIMKGILDFRQRIYGDKNLETIIAMDELRRVLLHQGKMEEAENLHRRALSLAKEVAGPTHLITLTLTESLEIYLLFPGKYPDAENMMRNGLKDEQNTPRTEDPILEKMREVALASFLSTKRFGSTEWGLHKVNVNFVQNTDGEVDIDKLMAMGYLGVLFQMLHLHAVAERLQRKCLELKVEVFGAENVLTLKEMNNLALSLTHQRKYEEAELLWEMAVTWAQKFLAPDDPDLETFEGNLREIRYDRERRDAEKVSVTCQTGP
jgi:tetratricopeptide (TPR) repeat protein